MTWIVKFCKAIRTFALSCVACGVFIVCVDLAAGFYIAAKGMVIWSAVWLVVLVVSFIKVKEAGCGCDTGNNCPHPVRSHYYDTGDVMQCRDCDDEGEDIK